MDQCLARLKQTLLIPAKETPNKGSKQFDFPSHDCISNDVKAKLSRKFHGEMRLLAFVFAKPMKIRARLFLFDKPIKCLHFTFVFTFIFQGHMEVALSLVFVQCFQFV